METFDFRLFIAYLSLHDITTTVSTCREEIIKMTIEPSRALAAVYFSERLCRTGIYYRCQKA